MPSGLQIRLCCCPRSRCTNRDWDESRAWWPPMRDFIRARTRKRGKRWACGGCRCPIRKPQVANGNVFSTSVGFVEGKSGGPGRRVESACSNEDMGYVVALSRSGRHATMGGAGRDCGQFHPDGVLSCATEHLSRHSPLASRARMDTRKITTEDHIRCVLCHRAYVRKRIFATKSS